MILIGDVAVSLDVIRASFACCLPVCRGQCCVEGDEGAPVADDEIKQLEQVVPIVAHDLTDEARSLLASQGVVYRDCDHEWVTSIVNGKDCVFAYHPDDKMCLCAIEKAYREGRSAFRKPLSCALYPLRVGQSGGYRRLSYHRWEVCDAAQRCAGKDRMPLYRYLKGPLIEQFGQEWYDELCLTADEMQKQGLI